MTTTTTTTTTNTVTATEVPPTTEVVDDIELLAILGLSPPPTSLSDDDDLAVLDWDDTPELSEEEEDIDDAQSMTGKRKRDHDDDLFAELDFIEVPLPPKKQRSFVEEDLSLELHTKLIDDEDIRLALDLISS